MNICIFGASSNDIDQAYMDAVLILERSWQREDTH